ERRHVFVPLDQTDRLARNARTLRKLRLTPIISRAKLFQSTFHIIHLFLIVLTILSLILTTFIVNSLQKKRTDFHFVIFSIFIVHERFQNDNDNSQKNKKKLIFTHGNVAFFVRCVEDSVVY